MVQLDNFVMMRWDAEATVVPAESRSLRLLLDFFYKTTDHIIDISIAAILASLHLAKLRPSNLYKKLSSTKKISLVILLMCHKLPQKYSSYISS